MRDFLAILTIVALGALAVYAGVRVAQANMNLPELGIIAAPSGEAVYIAGEACTVNMMFDRTPLELEEDWEHCMQQHVVWSQKEEGQ